MSATNPQSQTLPVLLNLLATTGRRETTDKYGQLLRTASSTVQYYRHKSATALSLDPVTAEAIRNVDTVIDPADELVKHFAVGYGLINAHIPSLVPGLTDEERMVAVALAGKVVKILVKQWKDGNKTEGTRLYDAIRSLG